MCEVKVPHPHGAVGVAAAAVTVVAAVGVVTVVASWVAGVIATLAPFLGAALVATVVAEVAVVGWVLVCEAGEVATGRDVRRIRRAQRAVQGQRRAELLAPIPMPVAGTAAWSSSVVGS